MSDKFPIRTAAAVMAAAVFPSLMATCTSPASAAAARRPVPEIRTVCVDSAYVEDAPASHPHGVVYRHDTFRVDRYVHTAHKGVWAHGTHLNKDRTRGWVNLAALCPASSLDRLVGQRKRVQIKQLLLYENPAGSYVGSLKAGDSFKVIRLSPTKAYAYGFAYGHSNRHAWVRTSRLIEDA
jgi:hypothetical protein